jgi:twinkle protein
MTGESLKNFINKAIHIAPDGILDFYSAFDDIYKYNFETDENYYKTGWLKLDNLLKIRTGHLMVVTGYPSRGKSTFVDNLLVNLSKSYNMRHLLASFENTQVGHYNTLLEMYHRAPISRIKKGQKLIFGEAWQWISEHFIRFDTDKHWSIDEIIEKTELCVKKYGIKTLTIDPYNRLKRDFKEREDLYIGEMLSKLCMLAKKLDILIIFIAHPKKPDNDKMPSMYGISGSGDWYNMADYGIIVHRERQPDKTLSNTPTISVAKVKNFSLGNPSGGSAELHYNCDLRVLENHEGELCSLIG